MSTMQNVYEGTLGEFIKEVYQPYFMSLGRKSEEIELKRLEIMLNHEIAKQELAKITKHDAMAFMSQLKAEREMGGASFNRYRSRFCHIYNYAIEECYVCNNPFARVKKAKEKPRKRVYKMEEAIRVLEEAKASKNTELYTIVVLALNTGMRKGEILKLELKHVDLRNKAINLSGKMTKSGEDRTIPLNEAALEVLVEHLRKNTSPKAVFKTNNFRTAWQNVLKRAGVHGATFHDLRRTFATYLKDGGVSLYSIKELLGHSSIIMTERYLASQGTVLAESVEKINFI